MDSMIVRYLPEQYFVGKLYVKAASRKNCSTQSTEDLGVLRIPIGDETRENSCGIVRAYQLINGTRTSPPTHNRTLISATVVIQNQPSVQSQGDRLIKVGCILNNNNNFNVNNDGNAKTSGADRQSKLLEVVTSEIQVAGLDVPTVGPSSLRPYVQLVDVDNNIESKVVEVGQNLQLRVFYTEDKGYDLEVVNLKATSQNGQEIYLLDYKGCPAENLIFPEMYLTDIDGVLTLVGQFMAFKFADSPYVDLSMTVRSCYKTCPARNCRNSGRSGRSRRQTLGPIVFPASSTLGPVIVPSPITFPSSKYTINSQLVDEEENDGDSLHNSIENVVHQRIISSFDEPFEDKVKKLAHTTNVEIKELSTNFSKMIEYPFRLRLTVFSASNQEGNSVNPESLIYGETSKESNEDSGESEEKITKAANTICVDQTFILCLLLFFAVLVVVLVIGCALLLFRYKRKLQQQREDDRNSLQRFQYGLEPFDSLSRRVHWADGFANARSAYP